MCTLHVLVIWITLHAALGAAALDDADDSPEIVTVATTLDSDLLGFLTRDVTSRIPGVRFMRTRNDDLMLLTLGSRDPSRFPDIFFGMSTNALSQLADHGYLAPHGATWAGRLPADLSDENHRWIALFNDPLAIIYNKQYQADGLLSGRLPDCWEDLAHPRFKGSLILGNPTPYNESGCLLACLIDRAVQQYRDDAPGFELLSRLQGNLLELYSNQYKLLLGIFNDNRGAISIASMSQIIKCVQSKKPVGIIQPEEGLFPFPKGIALTKKASDKAKLVYDALVESTLSDNLYHNFGCRSLLNKDRAGSRAGLETEPVIFRTRHIRVRKKIVSWIKQWRELGKDSSLEAEILLGDAPDGVKKYLVPALLALFLFYQHFRRRQAP